jgi:hypothetical protein
MKTFTAAQIIEIWNKIRAKDSCDESAVCPFFAVFDYHNGTGEGDYYKREIEYIKKNFPELLELE